MSATITENMDAAIPFSADERWTPAAPSAPDSRFWIAVSAALTLHVAVLVGIASKPPRQVGEANGAEDAISVSMVTESELNSRSMSAAAAELPPAQPAPTPPVETAQPPPEPKPEPKAAEPAPPVPDTKPEPEKSAETAPEPKQSEQKIEDRAELKPTTADDASEKPAEKPPAPESKDAKKTEGQDKVRATITEGLPDDALTIKEPVSKPLKQPQPKPPPKTPAAQPQKTAKLDLSLPQPSLQAPVTGGGRRASFERPPGITKSGANDDFARGVIRSLQATMPQLREVLGRVTVRITLNDNGNIVDVQVVRPSNLADVDQAVVFAARQTSYPFPPPNSVPADRTFVVTYIYK